MLRKGLLALAAVLMWSSGAVAHHRFSAEFDMNKPVTLTGTVTKIEWQSPHVFTYIDAKDDSGKTANWKVEMGSPESLTKEGWTRASVKMGDMVTVKGWRAKDGSNMANADSFMLPGGKTIAAASSYYGDPGQGQLAQNETAAPRPQGTAGQSTESLPRTASPLALYGLISALSLAGAAGIRLRRK
jgi:hypothetical protein